MAAARSSSKDDDTLADARHVHEKATAHFKHFAAADKGKKKPALPKSFLDGLKKDIGEADAARGTQGTSKRAVKKATGTEVKAREALHEAIARVRDDVAMSFTDDRDLQRSFGVGMKVRKTSTPALLDAAGTLLAAYQVAADAKKAKDAGVTPARMKSLAKLRQELADADTKQSSGLGARTSATSAKKGLMAGLKKKVAHVRKVAKSFFGSASATFKSFTRTTPKHTAKKRPKTAPAPVG